MNEKEEQLSESREVEEISSTQLSRMGFWVPTPIVRQVKPIAVEKSKGRRGRAPLDPEKLRLSQLRTLSVMEEVEADSVVTAVTLSQLSRKSGLSEQSLKQGLGPPDTMDCDKHDKVFGFRSLITRGIVVCSGLDGEHRYYLTQLGQQKLIELEDDIREAKSTPIRSGGVDKRTGPKAPKGPKKERTKRAPKRTKKDVEIQDIPTLE